MGHFCPPGSGSTDPIESGSNPDPDQQPWLGIRDISVRIRIPGSGPLTNKPESPTLVFDIKKSVAGIGGQASSEIAGLVL